MSDICAAESFQGCTEFWSTQLVILFPAVCQGDLNLNICEAHAFNTTDRFTLDVFVVNGWSGEVCPFLFSCKLGPAG